MNVIVSNKQKEIIDNANIDAIKDLNGLFNVDDLINKFKNYFFSKMILDATSVIDFASRDVLQKLVNEIGADRLIILLPSTPEPPDEFKKLLIDLKLYNYSNNIDDVVKYLEKPNTYENAMNTIANSASNSGNYYVDSSIKEGESDNQEDSNDSNLVSNDSNVNISHSSLDDMMSRFSVNDNFEESSSDNSVDSIDGDKINSNDGIITDDSVSQDSNGELANYNLNYSSSSESNTEVDSTSNNSYVFLNMGDFENTSSRQSNDKKVIGFRNVTLHAGSTSLIYMLQKAAQKANMNALSIEVNRDDFKLFRNNHMISVGESEILNTLNSLRENIALIDLNDCQDDSFCQEVIYLVEPSTLKLNKLMLEDKNIFNTLKEKKVILNKSMLSGNDAQILENEAGMKFFFNLEPLNDRVDNSVINELLDKLINE